MLRLRAPAKLNLGLRVLARRPDGYHEIETLFVPIDWCDDLDVRVGERPGIHLTVLGADLPSDASNLAVRAAALACAETGLAPRLELRLRKRIPVAAGLGGGSSDAAAALRAVRQLSGSPLPESRWRELALRLGADVPFFLDPRPSIGRGLGEQLEPLTDFPRLWCVLVAFPFGVSTAEVYQGATRELTLPRAPSSIPALLGPGLAASPPNDLEAFTVRHHPEIELARAALRDRGASVTGMSGSGPTVYGCFESRAQAQHAARGADFPAGTRVRVASTLGFTRSWRAEGSESAGSGFTGAGFGMGRSQAVRQRTLDPCIAGSNPAAPAKFNQRSGVTT
jgi:4-diphosphocytidyl-2-C-methyl-D-erythritol kinase